MKRFSVGIVFADGSRVDKIYERDTIVDVVMMLFIVHHGRHMVTFTIKEVTV